MPTSVSSASEWPVTKPLILTDLFTLANQPERLVWQRFRPGVEIYRLYGDEQTGPAAALLKYAPGAQVPYHSHTGYEHILVLSGAQHDHHGNHTTGTLVINSPETSHAVASEQGCIVLIIWEKPIVIKKESN